MMEMVNSIHTIKRGKTIMVNINKLYGGNITITIGPAGHSETRFTLKGGTVETHNITGTLD